MSKILKYVCDACGKPILHSNIVRSFSVDAIDEEDEIVEVDWGDYHSIRYALQGILGCEDLCDDCVTKAMTSLKPLISEIEKNRKME